MRDGIMAWGRDEVLALLRSHLPSEAVSTADEEYERLRLLPGKKQEEALRRLAVIDRYLKEASGSLAEAESAGAELGVSRRSFYRLLDNLRRKGPVLGLTPSIRTAERSSLASHGLGVIAEAAVKDLLIRHPNARSSQIVSEVRAACEAEGEPMPSEATLRRRVEFLRRPGELERLRPVTAEEARLARHLLIDQSALELVIRSPNGATSFAVATLIVDFDTRLVLASGVDEPSRPGTGFIASLDDYRRRISRLPAGPFAFAKTVRDLEWVLPTTLEELVRGDVGDLLLPGQPFHGVTLDTKDAGQRRHGATLLTLLGSRFGDFNLLPRSTDDPTVDWNDSMPSPRDHAEATAIIQRTVDEWNYAILLSVTGEPRQSQGAERQKQLKGWSKRKAPGPVRSFPDRFLPLMPQLQAAIEGDR